MKILILIVTKIIWNTGLAIKNGLPIAVNPNHVSSENNSSVKSLRNGGSESE